MSAAQPWVTCVCVTYGRFASMRDALSCFLLQDYPNKRLLVLNDAPKPLALASRSESIAVHNAAAMFENLGAKRQAGLLLAETELVAHWDDDDLYLPWHLSRSVASLARTKSECVKSGGAWFMKGTLGAAKPGDEVVIDAIRHNNFEGTMVFDRKAALDRGGYPPLHSGQAMALMNAFGKARKLHVTPDQEAGADEVPFTELSYIYRWGQRGVGHISAFGNTAGSLQRFIETNRDFGDGPLTAADLSGYWTALRKGSTKLLGEADCARYLARLAARATAAAES